MTSRQPQPHVYQVLHTDEGTVLALCPAEAVTLQDGTRLGSVLIPVAGELVTEVELTAEQRRTPLAHLLEDHDIALDFSAKRLVFTPRQKAD
jgi:hypothetical protein